MTILQAILLGIVQGVTEFLPISSSGHLVIVPHILRWEIPAQEAFFFDVLVQLGTLLAVIVYYYSDLFSIARAWLTSLKLGQSISNPNAKIGWYLILATIPAVAAGLLFRDPIERAFGSMTVTAVFLLGTGGLLLLAELVGKRSRTLENLNWMDALWTGIFQALALFPGISRSGAAISGSMTRDLERPAAARFAFLMVVPVMLGAGLVALIDMFSIQGWKTFIPEMLVGFATSAVVGYLVISWLLRYLANNTLYPFVIYLLVLGTLLLTIF
ncbi:MAG: undecaprenyl-diphosphatase UppP [Chloroflexi bacterium]|nr:undecaprenyl-diphosphatase UppP [Chloroflexota bacterium]